MKKSQFEIKKESILQQLSVPLDEYNDLSPKGSVDVEIAELVQQINSQPGLVTTSSCAGRISVFLEGCRSASLTNSSPDTTNGQSQKNVRASEGGKGGGGRFLFVSHAPLTVPSSHDSINVKSYTQKFGMKLSDGRASDRLVHFKFEPMILHVLTASLSHAQKVVSAALQAGFRESGAVNIVPTEDAEAMPMVAVRSTGLAFESIVGSCAADETIPTALVGEEYIGVLVARANERFEANAARIRRFQSLLLKLFMQDQTQLRSSITNIEWEDSVTRKERKRNEGLARQAQLRQNGVTKDEVVEEPPIHNFDT